MRTYRDAKAMARALKTALAEKDIALSHGACLDIVAAQFARDNWNVLAAEIDAADDGRPAPPAAPRTGPDFRDTIPILRIFAVDKAMEFYVGFLGFKVDWEHRFGDNFSVGLEYLYTTLDDDEARVEVGPGSAGATNPFLIVNPLGTDFARSDDEIELNSLRLTANWRF